MRICPKEHRTPEHQFLVTLAMYQHARDHGDEDVVMRVNRNARLAARIKECTTSGGEMYVQQHGRDCDGYRYHYAPRLIEASAKAYWEAMYSIERYADGPFGLAILTPEQAAELNQAEEEEHV